ncbi:hypothetical protein ALT_1219 [Aspergillus lentulus]|uniref:Uncharacterized protein n=1 Tax=Aspergillus lentulus TaxID=293939 RepID=A0AAN4PD29_ASPLE|nr:hypothetical protein ALT_1219 [Aspergillus lentulus]
MNMSQLATLRKRWYDLNDRRRHFTDIVPILARKNALLLSAILAFAAASQSSSSGSTPLKDLADAYHLESVRRLLALMKHPDEFRTGETLAAICLLRSYEIISQNVTCQNHLQGSYSLLANHPIELESGLLSAGFWNYLREDITVALLEKRSLMIQLPDGPLPTRIECDDDLANRITYLLGRVINKCLLRDAAPLDQCEWNSLRDQLEDWRISLPSSFDPILTPHLLPNSSFPTTTTTTNNMTIRHISINDMTLDHMLINDLLNSNIILRNKIADDLANTDIAIEDTVIHNLADSKIDVKSIVIDKLSTMNMILTELAKTIRPLKAWSGMTSSAATSTATSTAISTATSPSQAWSLITPTETPPSENEEDDPDWPFVGRKGPLPPSPPLRQRAPTPDEVTEEFLSHTLYPLFGLSRHPNPRGLWTLEQNEKAPLPPSLVRNLAILDKNDPQYLDHETSCKRIRAILNHCYVEELDYRKQNPAKRSSAVLSIPRCRGFEQEVEALGVRFPIEGELDFVVNNAAEPGNGIGVVICVNSWPSTILRQCISFMALCHDARQAENKRLTSVYGVATNGKEFYFLEIDDNDMISFHRTILRPDSGTKMNEVYSYFRRFFRDIMDRKITPIPGTRFKPSISPSRLY